MSRTVPEHRWCCHTAWQRRGVAAGIYAVFFIISFSCLGNRHAAFPWMFYTATVRVTSAAVELGACPASVDPIPAGGAGTECWNGVVTLQGPRGDCDPFYPEISAQRNLSIPNNCDPGKLCDFGTLPDPGIDRVQAALDLTYPINREITGVAISEYDPAKCALHGRKEAAQSNLLAWALIFETCFVLLTVLVLSTCHYCAGVGDSEAVYYDSMRTPSLRPVGRGLPVNSYSEALSVASAPFGRAGDARDYSDAQQRLADYHGDL
jgi:hypothetical protein